MKKVIQIILSLMVFKFFAYETQSLRTEWDDEKSIMDPRVQHLSYIFEETGETIPYALFIPSSYEKGKDISLMVSLHGLTRTYDWLMGYEGLLDLAEDNNFMIVTPLGYTRKGWYGSWTRGLDRRSLEKEGRYSERDVMNVLALIKKNYSIDDKDFLFSLLINSANTFLSA